MDKIKMCEIDFSSDVATIMESYKKESATFKSGVGFVTESVTFKGVRGFIFDLEGSEIDRVFMPSESGNMVLEVDGEKIEEIDGVRTIKDYSILTSYSLRYESGVKESKCMFKPHLLMGFFYHDGARWRPKK